MSKTISTITTAMLMRTAATVPFLEFLPSPSLLLELPPPFFLPPPLLSLEGGSEGAVLGEREEGGREGEREREKVNVH